MEPAPTATTPTVSTVPSTTPAAFAVGLVAVLTMSVVTLTIQP